MTIQDYTTIGDWILNAVIVIVVLWNASGSAKGIKSIKKGLDEHTAVDEVKAMIHQRLEIVSIETMRYIQHLDPTHRDVLVAWAERFEEFAINSYFSKYRKSKDIELYLETKSGSLRMNMDSLLLQVAPEKKNNKTIIEFAAESDIHKEVDLLVRALIHNGLTPTKYVDLFVDSVSRILDEGVKLLQNWKALK